MAQVACVKVPASGWAKIEDLIKEALDDDIGTNATAITALETLAGDTALPTTAQTLTGAIAELNMDVSHCAIVG